MNRSIDTRLYWLRVPAIAMQVLRVKGFHDGYQRRAPLEVDERVATAFHESNIFRRKAILRKWLSDIRREAVLLDFGRATLWHPNLTTGDEQFIREWLPSRIVEIDAATPEQALHFIHLTKWNFGVFYHVACMGNWRNVVEEHLQLLSRVGLNGIHVGILGTAQERSDFQRLAIQYNIDISIDFQHTDLGMYEMPTIQLVNQWAEHNNGYLLYFHTKGVSDPSSSMKADWRRLMNRFVIERWQDNAQLLANGYDVVGVNWRDRHCRFSCERGTAHFTGNYWMATTTYLRKLENFFTYYSNPIYLEKTDIPRRLWAEFWIGSGQLPRRTYSHVSTNERMGLPQYWDKPGRRSVEAAHDSFEHRRISRGIRNIDPCTRNTIDDGSARGVVCNNSATEPRVKYFIPIYGSYYHFITESALSLYHLLKVNSIMESLDCKLWYQGTFGPVVQIFSCYPIVNIPIATPHFQNAGIIDRDIRTLRHIALERPDFIQLVPLMQFLTSKIPIVEEPIGITIIRRANKRVYLETDILAERVKIFRLPVRVVQLENETFADQVNIMRNTTILVAPHGAGTINQMFMPTGSTIIELFPKGYSDWHQAETARVFGHKLIEIESLVPGVFGREPSDKIRRFIEEHGWPDRQTVRTSRKLSQDLHRVVRDVSTYSIDPQRIVNAIKHTLNI